MLLYIIFTITALALIFNISKSQTSEIQIKKLVSAKKSLQKLWLALSAILYIYGIGKVSDRLTSANIDQASTQSTFLPFLLPLIDLIIFTIYCWVLFNILRKIKMKAVNQKITSIKNTDQKTEQDLKVKLIKLGFEKENGFKLANKDMYEMSHKQLEKYYKIGLKTLNKK